MSDSLRPRSNLSVGDWAELGAYASPFSGTGVEFLPMAVSPEDGELVLHEAGYLPRRPHWNYPNVFTPYWRLYYDFRPGHRVVFPHREVPLGPDRFVLIPTHQLFSTVGTEPRPHFWIAFSYSEQPAPGQAVPFELRPGKTEVSLVRDITKLLQATEGRLNRQRIYHGALALLHLLLSRPEIQWQRKAPGKLANVIRYIESHYTSPLSGKHLAELAHMSESVFRRQFRELRNSSPGRFIAQLRVRMAAHLLATTSMDMAEIAERCGFPNCAYFSRVFRKITMESPAQFRRKAGATLLGER